MVSLLLIVSALLGMQATAEASTFKMEGKRSVVVNRVPNPKFSSRSGPEDLFRTYRKYGMPVPENLTRRIKARSIAPAPKRRAGRSSAYTDKSGSSFGSPAASHGVNYASNNVAHNQVGSVAATPNPSDVSYLSPVKIGGQTMNMILDTGSSDLWVYGSKLPAAKRMNHRIYNNANSSTWSELKGSTFQITYGDYSFASGYVGTDSVNIGGVMVKKQAVEVASVISDELTQPPYNDGILGLGFSSLNAVQPTQQKTFFENIADSLKEPFFAANLKHGTPGSYSFGSIDHHQYQGDLSWTPIDKSGGWWQFKAGVTTAIADTGTTLILANSALVEGYYKLVKGAEFDKVQAGFVFPCDAKLPDLDLPIGRIAVRLRGEWLNYSPLTQGSKKCFGGLQISTAEDGMGVYGDILFKKVFFVFDIRKERVGFAFHADL